MMISRLAQPARGASKSLRSGDPIPFDSTRPPFSSTLAS